VEPILTSVTAYHETVILRFPTKAPQPSKQRKNYEQMYEVENTENG